MVGACGASGTPPRQKVVSGDDACGLSGSPGRRPVCSLPARGNSGLSLIGLKSADGPHTTGRRSNTHGGVAAPDRSHTPSQGAVGP